MAAVVAASVVVWLSVTVLENPIASNKLKGTGGIHSMLEQANPTYVRRRCLAHLSWRVATAGLDAMGECAKDVIAINTYIRDGTTWYTTKPLALPIPKAPNADGIAGRVLIVAALHLATYMFFRN